MEDLERADLERIVMRLQSLAREQRELLDHLAERSPYVRRRLRELDEQRGNVPQWVLRMIGRVPDSDRVRQLAAENDERVWGRV